MKKFLLPLLTLVVLFAGCRKEEIIRQEIYRSGTEMTVKYIDVAPAEWVTNSSVDYYYATVTVPEITDDVIENGCVLAYYVDASERDNQLPYLLPQSESVYYVDTHLDTIYTTDLWTLNFRYDVEKSNITFIMESSDFHTDADVANLTGNCTFKVVILAPAE